MSTQPKKQADWDVTVRLDRTDVATLRTILDDPAPGSDLSAVDRLADKFERIWQRKESD